MSFLANIPREGQQYNIGGADHYVYEVDADGSHSTGYGRYNISDKRVIVTLHDNNGDEVELRLPFPNCPDCGDTWGEDPDCETCTDEDGDMLDFPEDEQ